MVRYNGSPRTRSYEDVNLYIGNYLNRIKEYRAQHQHLSKIIHTKFTELCEDYNSKAISEDDFRKCLKDFQGVISEYNEYALPDLHLDQIKKEVQKYFGS